MTTKQTKPLSERPPKRKPYERPYGGRVPKSEKIEPTIKFRDDNEPPKRLRNNSSGRRNRRIPEIICEECGKPIEGTNGLRRNPRQKFHKECRPYPSTADIKRKKQKIGLGNQNGETFIKRFDETFALASIIEYPYLLKHFDNMR